MKIFKRFILLIFAFCAFAGVALFSGTGVSADSLKDSNVSYNSVDKEIVISEKKVLDVTEKVSVNFARSGVNVGLSRNISRLSKISRLYGGKTYSVITYNSLSNVSVTVQDSEGEHEEFFFIDSDQDYYYINTGRDYDYKPSGEYIYTFHYTYDMGADFISDFDDFTFDIMDNGYPSEVAHFSARITLPKEFYQDESELEQILTYRTPEGAIAGSALNQTVEGNTISVECDNLPPYSGIAMQLILPNGYFSAVYRPDTFYIVIMVTSILCALGVLGVFLFSQRQKKCVQTVEFYPPKDFNPIDVAKIYRSGVKSEDFASLVIEWTSKGLIDLSEREKGDFVLTKLKDFPEVDKDSPNYSGKLDEKRYFDAIFSEGNTYSTRQNKYNFNQKISSAASLLYEINPKQKKMQTLLRGLVVLLSFIPCFLYFIWGCKFMPIGYPLMFILLFPLIAILISFYTSIPLGFRIVWSLIFGGVPLALLIAQNTVYDVFGLCYITLALLILLNIFGLFTKAYLKEHKKLRGQILGFKNFLVTSELEKLEMLIKENPNYYYDILPYCYVFGITKIMEEKFKSLHVENPTYCQGSVTDFHHAMAISMIAMLPHRSSGGNFRNIGGFGGGAGGSFTGGGGGGGMHGR